MTWAERIRASLSGDLAGGDVRALLAASSSLDLLRQQLGDRRLSAQIDHIGEEWRVLAAIAPLAMPLWLGDGLVTLARGICDGEAEAHPDRPQALSVASHALAVAVLRPIETIVAETSAAAADPGRPPWITAAVMVGPRGEVAAFSLPAPIPVGYITGLSLAAERLHGAAGILLAELTTLLQPSQPPTWLTAGIQRVKGDLAAAGARLAMLRTRLTMLTPDGQHFSVGNDTLAPICHDLWEVINTALVGGQRLSDPRLFPGARAADAPPVRPAPTVSSPYPSQRVAAPHVPVAPPPAPPRTAPPTQPPPRVERARDLPDIQTLPAAAEHSRHPSIVRDDRRSRPSEPNPSALPEIGGPSTAPGPSPSKAASALPKIEVPKHPKDTEVLELPQIGPE